MFRARRALPWAVGFVMLGAVGCDQPSAPPPVPVPSVAPSASAAPAPGFTASEQESIAHVTAASISGPLRYLSSDLLEGRGTGSRGDDLAMHYVASEFEAAGLQPGAGQGEWLQRVPLVGMTEKLPPSATFAAGGKNATLAIPDDLVVMAGLQQPHAQLDAAEVVFVGYGIVAPEYQWDDYAGADVKGKVVLVMNDDPSSDPVLFAGKTRLWYGRWDYKYLEAARHGAVGAIVIHTTESAAYPWQVVTSSNTGEKFDLPAHGEPRLVARMWATEDASRKIASLGGKDLDELRKTAVRGFHAVPLGVKVSLAMDTTLRKVESANVIGVLPGTDPVLGKQAVVYTAHHDHLGIGAAKNGDSIYNGALDNASGVASLIALARAASASPHNRRSMIFMAVTAEEQGLLGSEWYAEHPTIPAGAIAANINMDGLDVWGKTSDVGFTGFGKSSLDDLVVAVAGAQGRTVHGDPFPEKGGFYRSDQFSFAKIGVPGVYAKGGPSFVGKPAGWGEAKVKEFETLHYHQPSDEFDPTWDFSGAVDDLQMLLVVGERVAEATALPSWKPHDEFEAARKAALAAPH